jgi:nucleoside-diphosphate-sugar epimerase
MSLSRSVSYCFSFPPLTHTHTKQYTQSSTKPFISSKMTFLLIGGTGKTATRVAASLAAANKPFLLASRRGPDASPNGYPAIKFDWTVESSWDKAFENGQVEAVYMMEPQVDRPWVPMIKFVDLARQKGVQRFVLCAASVVVYGFVVPYSLIHRSRFMGFC